MKEAGEQPSVVVFGAGSIGLRHLRNLRALGVDRLAAFEPDPARRETAEREIAAPVFSRLDEVWEFGPQAVVIAAPTQHHLSPAVAAADFGAHLFIEKPLAHTLSGVDQLLQLVAAKNLMSMVGCNMRFHPGPIAVRQLLEEKAIGEVLNARVQSSSYLPGWRPAQDYRRSYSASTEWGGAILDCIHEIDLTLWYFGPGRLLAAATKRAASLGLETDGMAELLIRHDAGMLSSVNISFIQRDYRRGCQIAGTQGSIYWDFAKRRVWTFDENGQPARAIPEPAGWEVNQMYVDEMKHFLEAVRTGTPAVNALPEARATLELSLQARDPKWNS